MELGKRQAVATIAAESERLFNLAKASGNDFIAGLIRVVLDEARATLMGHATLPGRPKQTPTSVVPFTVQNHAVITDNRWRPVPARSLAKISRADERTWHVGSVADARLSSGRTAISFHGPTGAIIPRGPCIGRSELGQAAGSALKSPALRSSAVQPIADPEPIWPIELMFGTSAALPLVWKLTGFKRRPAWPGRRSENSLP